MGREIIMETLSVLPKDFKMSEFLEALYERVHAYQGIKDVENGNETDIDDIIKEYDNEG